MLVAYDVSLQVVRALPPIVERIRKHDLNLAKQLVDAINSTVQNLAEGSRHRAGNKRLKFDIAFGEAQEVKASLDLALAWGYTTDDRAAREPLMRLLALCWGLTHGPKPASA
jgi:four helix bundle protein